MRHLLQRAWALHERAERAELPYLVRPSAPILFFGDSGKYERSALKAITVGLNPSKAEFPPEDPFGRFPATREITPPLLDGSLDAYRAALDEYFRIDPYRAWFKPSFESLLRGLDSSYFDGAENAALHTDLCSPLATDPTWSGLDDSEQAALIQDGSELWHELVEYLQPDVVLISVKRAHLAKIRFPVVTEPRPIYKVERDRSYVIELSRRKLDSGKEPYFVFGMAAQKPFGLISSAAKRAAGEAIREALDAG